MRNLFEKLLWVGFFIALFFPAINVLRPHFWSFSPFLPVFIFLAINIVFRFFKFSLGKKFFMYSFFLIAPFLALFSVVVRLVEFNTFPNFVYSTFHIDPTALSLFYFSFIFLLFANVHFEVIKKYRKFVLFVLPVLASPVYLIYFYSVETYESMRHEDGLFEYLTAFAYLFVSFVSAATIFKIKKLKLKKIPKIFLILLFAFFALSFFVVAGEEVSWGQRIFGITTPDYLVDANAQEETNLHNLNVVASYIYPAYAIFGLYCMFSWILKRGLKKLKLPFKGVLDIISPNWYLMLYFAPMVIYSLVRHYTHNRWEELSELFLAVGILIFFAEHFFHISSYFKKADKKY